MPNLDKNELLKAENCMGVNLTRNILRYLGVNETIINNPVAIEKLDSQIFMIASQNGIERTNYHVVPPQEQVYAIVSAVESSHLLSSEERIMAHSSLSIKSREQSYSGISVDKNTGAVTIDYLHIIGSERAFSPFDNRFSTTTFSAEKEGGIKQEFIQGELNSNHQEVLTDENTAHFNKDGITMETENKSYHREQGEDKLTYHCITKRDEEYPFIAKRDTLLYTYPTYSAPDTKYMLIKLEDLSQIDSPEYEKDEQGVSIGEITFNDREEVSEYYEANKEVITEAIMQQPNPAFVSDELRREIQVGMQALAKEVGLLPAEESQQTFDDGLSQ